MGYYLVAWKLVFPMSCFVLFSRLEGLVEARVFSMNCFVDGWGETLLSPPEMVEELSCGPTDSLGIHTRDS